MEAPFLEAWRAARAGRGGCDWSACCFFSGFSVHGWKNREVSNQLKGVSYTIFALGGANHAQCAAEDSVSVLISLLG